MSDFDRLATLFERVSAECPLEDVRPLAAQIIAVVPELIAVAQRMAPRPRGDGRTTCQTCCSAWLMPSLEMHAPGCEWAALLAKLTAVLGEPATDNAEIHHALDREPQ